MKMPIYEEGLVGGEASRRGKLRSARRFRCGHVDDERLFVYRFVLSFAVDEEEPRERRLSLEGVARQQLIRIHGTTCAA